MFLLRVLLVLLWDCLFWLGLPYIPRFWPHIYAISTEIFMKNSSIWYSTCSCPGDLPNEREISDSFICEQFSIKTPSQNPHTKSPENSWKCRLLNFHKVFGKFSACSSQHLSSNVQNTMFDHVVPQYFMEKYPWRAGGFLSVTRAGLARVVCFKNNFYWV